MLNDKGRRGLRHLPARRKWPAFETGFIRLPATQVRGGWGAGWYDWLPWEILGFTVDGTFAFLKSLADGSLSTISTRSLSMFEEIRPRGIRRSTVVPTPEYPWLCKNAVKGKRYV